MTVLWVLFLVGISGLAVAWLLWFGGSPWQWQREGPAPDNAIFSDEYNTDVVDGSVNGGSVIHGDDL